MFEPFDEEFGWEGHYDKPVGKEPVFHVTWDGEIRICQNLEWDRYLFPAVMDSDARALARAVNDCKARYSYNGNPGGSFCINEFGIVLVPISTGGNGYILPQAIGRWTGELRFQTAAPKYPGFADNGSIFSLNTDMEPGERWPHPYIGMKYHLAERGHIYYKLDEADERSYPKAPKGNDEIIRRLRRIRGYGSLSFLVNNHGIVLTKVNDDPVYVGRIDMKSWYPDPLLALELSDEKITEMIKQLNKLDRRRWKDLREYESVLTAYRDGGRCLDSDSMKQKLLTIFRNHLGGSGR